MINISKRIELTEKQIEELINLHNQKKGRRKIAKEMGIGDGVVYRYLKELNLETIKSSDMAKYTYDREVFKKIDSSEKAYWLGFLYADGCVHRNTLSIRLMKEDDVHLKKFLNFLKSNKTMQYGEQNSFGTIVEYVLLQINSVDIVKDLKRLGCVERKSLILTFPSEDIVPKTFIMDFIRGYLDGDGSIKHSKPTDAYEINFVGTDDMLLGILEVFGKQTKLRKRRETDVCSYFSIGGNLQVLSLLDKIYNNATVYLDRKYERYLKLKEKYSKM